MTEKKLKSPQFLEPSLAEVSSELLNKVSKERMSNFVELLDEMDGLKTRKKLLWKHIYENAIIDRNNSYLAFSDLYMEVQQNKMNYGIHAQNLTKFLERMQKSSDQLIKLAELIANEQEEQDVGPNMNEIYDKINK